MICIKFVDNYIKWFLKNTNKLNINLNVESYKIVDFEKSLNSVVFNIYEDINDQYL